MLMFLTVLDYFNGKIIVSFFYLIHFRQFIPLKGVSPLCAGLCYKHRLFRYLFLKLKNTASSTSIWSLIGMKKQRIVE